jgi:hypothetical protein
VAGDELYKDCFTPVVGASQLNANAPVVPQERWSYDYPCRGSCWEILYSPDILVFDDRYANGRLISQQRVAQIPFYGYQPALVDVRQLSLTADAYRYYKLFADQTQKTAGLVDVPPTALGGNVYLVANPQATLRPLRFRWCITGWIERSIRGRLMVRWTPLDRI